MHLARRVLDRFGRWRFVALTLLAIFAVSSVPNYFVVTEPPRHPFDKAVHFSEYAVLAALFVAAASQQRRSGVWMATIFVCAIAFTALYGVSDELHQRLVHGRDPEVHDWIADVLGGATGALVAAIALRSRNDGRATPGGSA